MFRNFASSLNSMHHHYIAYYIIKITKITCS
uniref:Uncharacterized protein n=1 Tax=Arundo donax TaxID=35708 RepID=A0A0A8XT09_ARUDO